jgi:hypothetical protein
MEEGGAELTGEAGDIRVPFGPGPTQDVPLEWAARMLASLKDAHPVQFGKLLAEAALAAK